MICDYGERVLCSLQPVAPLFKCQFNSQQLPVPDVIILLRWGKLLGVECARVEKGRLSVVLRQYRSHPRSGGIHLYDERELGFHVFEDGSGAEGSLQLFKSGDGFWGPGQGLGLMAQQRSDGGREEAKVVNESSVEIGES